MENLINEQWRAHMRRIPADDIYDAIADVDWDAGGSWSWCCEMALDADDIPRVMRDYGICADDELPDVDDGNLLVACPITADTTKQDLSEFDAASESDWESVWPIEDDGDDGDEDDDD